MQTPTPTITIEPDLDWSEYQNAGVGDAYADIPTCGGDYAKAIAVCIGSMQCMRPIDKGVMCPSFRVSGDGNLSPGGRVRLLKAAMKGELGVEPFNNEALKRSMDSCVSCKGCKRECDSNVDMAKIRAEYRAQRMKLNPPSLRDRVFAELPKLLRFRYLFRLAASLHNRLPMLAKLSEKYLGVPAACELPIPVFHSKQLKELTRKSRPTHETGIAGFDSTKVNKLVLFTDTFYFHFHPEVLEKSYLLLTKLGFEVILLGAGNEGSLCCGRTYFSGGFLAQARQEAQSTLAALLPYISQGLPVIGVEPSCILMFRDEYKNLALGESANLLAQQTYLLEEFLAKEMAAGRIAPAFNPYQFSGTLIVHGHCHEKSVGAMKSLRRLLKAIPEIKFEILDNSCCGGAGSFAYESEHLEMSQRMGHQAFSSIIDADVPVLTSGFSCNSQLKKIAKLTKPIHLAEFLYQHLV